MKKYVIEPGKNAVKAIEGPEPSLGPNEVKVRVKAASSNYRDILMLQFADQEIIPFSDGAGEVIAVGANVTQLKSGDRVSGLFFPTWIDGRIDADVSGIARGGGNVDGMLAEVVVGDEKSFITIPDHLSFEEAAALPCAGLTAWHAMFEHGRPAQAGQTILIQGTGGVSVFALQLAVAHGLDAIVLSSSDEKLERAKSMGAAHTINYRTIPGWDGEVLKLTGDKGVDMVLEVGGAGTLEKSMNAVKVNGVISLIGVLSGLDGTVNPLPIVQKSIQVFGIYVGSKEMQSHFHDALSRHTIKPVIDRVFEFDDAAEAYEYQKAGKHFGNIVVNCS